MSGLLFSCSCWGVVWEGEANLGKYGGFVSQCLTSATYFLQVFYATTRLWLPADALYTKNLPAQQQHSCPTVCTELLMSKVQGQTVRKRRRDVQINEMQQLVKGKIIHIIHIFHIFHIIHSIHSRAHFDTTNLI